MDTSGPFAALKQCEEELRKFASEAAAEGDYDALARLGATARTISEIARDWRAADLVQNNSTSEAGTAAPAPTRAGSEAIGSRGRGGRGASRDYPRFLRRGDELVKIGWSKSDRREYQHRAGHAVLLTIRQALLDSSKRKKLFTMGALKLQFGANGAPGYQAYVWLAWLRAAGLVTQHGRQGYSLVKPATFEKEVERVFAAVPVQEP